MIRLKVIPISWSMKCITLSYLRCFHTQFLWAPSDANRLLCQTFNPCVKIMLTMMAKYLLLSACRRKHLALNLQLFKSRAIMSVSFLCLSPWNGIKCKQLSISQAKAPGYTEYRLRSRWDCGDAGGESGSRLNWLYRVDDILAAVGHHL